jgi:hypothetical protein
MYCDVRNEGLELRERGAWMGVRAEITEVSTTAKRDIG